jgi:hypothetical protein
MRPTYPLIPLGLRSADRPASPEHLPGKTPSVVSGPMHTDAVKPEARCIHTAMPIAEREQAASARIEAELAQIGERQAGLHCSSLHAHKP